MWWVVNGWLWGGSIEGGVHGKNGKNGKYDEGFEYFGEGEAVETAELFAGLVHRAESRGVNERGR